MSKNLITILIGAALLGFCLAQQASLNAVSNDLNDSKARIAELEQALGEEQESGELVRNIALANHRKIQKLDRKRVVTVTAYSPREGETDDTPFITASNAKVREGIVAVSRDLFDKGWVFGKKVYIKGMGVFTIEDLMARRKRNQIDIFMYDTDNAIAFGRKKMEAYLLDA
jgi:3D (Asp-Asp-Asp) domain-containing protein